MNYCPKCGKQLNEGDLFCSNCGLKLERNETISEEKEENVGFSYVKKEEPITMKGSHPLSIAGLVLGIISFVLIIIFMGIAFANVYEELDESETITIGMTFMISLITTLVSLGTSIPGLIITVKRKGKIGLPVTALVFAGISAFVFLFMFTVTGLR